MSRCGSSTVMAGIGRATCAGSRARRRMLRPAHVVSFNPMAHEASQGAMDATSARNQRKAHRGARSTCTGGRVKSGDVDPVSPAR
jgi:hypothetical protein